MFLTKNFKKFGGIFKSLPSASFSTKVEIFPDQIVNNLRKAIDSHEKDLSSHEADILDNIHFFDTDQFLDIVSILSFANKGTEALWDILSRKVFDYDLDLIQSYMLEEALQHCDKHDYFMEDQLARDVLVWETKWPKESSLLKNKLL